MRIVPKPRIRRASIEETKRNKVVQNVKSWKCESWEVLQVKTRIDDRSRRNFREWSRDVPSVFHRSIKISFPRPLSKCFLQKCLPTRCVMHQHRLNRDRLADVEAKRATQFRKWRNNIDREENICARGRHLTIPSSPPPTLHGFDRSTGRY